MLAFTTRWWCLSLDVDLCSFDVLLQGRISMLFWTDMMALHRLVFTRDSGNVQSCLLKMLWCSIFSHAAFHQIY